MKTRTLSAIVQVGVASAVFIVAALSSHAAIHYVSLLSASPSPPYGDWSTAATNIQDAVDVANAGDEVVVTNGVYATGGRTVTNLVYDYVYGHFRTNVTMNRVLVPKAISLRSISGPQYTEINGGGTNRCAYLTNGASLTGFCLRQGLAELGAGVYCTSTNAVLTNCLITENAAEISGVPGAGEGGGVYGGTVCSSMVSSNTAGYGGGVSAAPLSAAVLYDSVLHGNDAGFGGAAFRSILYNCTVSSNSASDGGGVSGDGNRRYALDSCTLIGNSASFGGGGAYDTCDLYNCLLTGNVARNGGAAAGRSGSLGLFNCTVTGNQATGSGGGTYSANAYNCILYYNTAPTNANYDPWPLQPHLFYCCTTPMPPAPSYANITNKPLFLDWTGGDLHLQSASPCINAGSVAYATGVDLDGNPRIVGGMPDIGAYEYQGANGGFLISAISATGADISLTWRSVAGRTYYVECSTNDLGAYLFFPLVSNIASGGATTSWTHTNAVGLPMRFYRVGLQRALKR